jgi:predicted amidohydrolase
MFDGENRLVEAAALSLRGGHFHSRESYGKYIGEIAAENSHRPALLVLPAHNALFCALSWGDLGASTVFKAAGAAFWELIRSNNYWYEQFLELHAALARKHKVHLVSGTILEIAEDGLLYHSAHLFSPEGALLGLQRQTHLSRTEKDFGFSRGVEVNVFSTPIGKLGIVVGADAWYPEVGRILALQGAEIVCHCGAALSGSHPVQQLAGMWAQVQQNQFFCVESQLATDIAGTTFGAQSAIHAPCEMTDGKTGFLARDESGAGVLRAILDQQARHAVIDAYPILKHLNPDAYRRYPPENER